MTGSSLRKLVRRYVTLGVLIACLGFFAFSSNTGSAKAAICCSDCDVNLQNCYDGCGDPASGACLFFCEHQYNRCLSHCDSGC